MLMPSTPVATPFAPAQTATARTATVEANSRADFDAQLQLAKSDEARAASIHAMQAAARDAQSRVPAPMTSLSTVAIAGAMNSLPAALDMLQRIAMASASGTLSDADRQTLQADYAQLNANGVSSVGAVSASQQQQTSTQHDDERDDNAENMWRE